MVEADDVERAKAESLLARYWRLGSGDEWKVIVPVGHRVLPAPSGGHLDQDERVAIQAWSAGTRRCYMVELEMLVGDARRTFAFVPDVNAFDELDESWRLSDIAVLAEDGSWVFLCSRHDFWLLIAPAETHDELFAELQPLRQQYEDLVSTSKDPPWRLARAARIRWWDVVGKAVTI